jgi:uncharacterized ferritin-like protein (DUF455 family)
MMENSAVKDEMLYHILSKEEFEALPRAYYSDWLRIAEWNILQFLIWSLESKK